MNVRDFNYYRRLSISNAKSSIGDTLYGNYLTYPGLLLTERMESEGFYWTTEDSFDIAIFTDLDEELMAFARSLPQRVKKILQLVGSPVYTPYAHHPNILFSDIWSAVMTYNREFEARGLRQYDIPVTGIQYPLPHISSVRNTHPRGVFIGSFKNDMCGFGVYRDMLMLQLADAGYIDIYGHGWPMHPRYRGKTDDKIRTLSQYRYVICVENAKYSGYVTGKIGESILAERPCLYFGDALHAHKRFGKTFVELPELSVAAFKIALDELNNSYDSLYTSSLDEKARSGKWVDSYINSTLWALRRCKATSRVQE